MGFRGATLNLDDLAGATVSVLVDLYHQVTLCIPPLVGPNPTGTTGWAPIPARRKILTLLENVRV